VRSTYHEQAPNDPDHVIDGLDELVPIAMHTLSHAEETSR
jgi:hypothetical protein